MMGVRIDCIDRQDFFDAIDHGVATGGNGTILNVNAHAMNLAYEDAEFRRILNAADIVFVDGFGINLAASLCGNKAGERLTVMDWFDDLLEASGERDWPLFWLGDEPHVVEKFKEMALQKHPGAKLAGAHHGFFKKTGPESDAIIEMIQKSGAKVLLAGMGMPNQEKWMWANRDRLPPVRLAMGAAIKFYTGTIKRGPEWMTQYGLEWLHRLTIQPKHTWKRYIVGNPLFISRAVINHYFRGDKHPEDQ
jgi:N-acetylglucosaminyldiphosphoundecaprenol N-acetyl-beta-D-mannosaminyltransferase